MAKHELLNNITHKDLRIVTRRSAEFGDDIASVLTFPSEFRNILGEFPICICKDPDSGKFHFAALMGFEDKENLFLVDDKWDASYIPLMLERQPFLIGQRQLDSSGDEQILVHIDMESSRVSSTDGELVFLEKGGNSAYLQRISSVLQAIYDGGKQSQLFIEQLLKHELVESFSLDVELDDGSKNQLKGFYTISEEKLGKLPIDVLEGFMRSGMLQGIYMVIASLSNFRNLIARKNKQLC
jgi:hypothetical protein